MPAFFIALLSWIEESALAVWVGESTWGFPISLVLHAFGMGLLAGGNLAMGLRLLGAAPAIPLIGLLRLYPPLWGRNTGDLAGHHHCWPLSGLHPQRDARQRSDWRLRWNKRCSLSRRPPASTAS